MIFYVNHMTLASLSPLLHDKDVEDNNKYIVQKIEILIMLIFLNNHREFKILHRKFPFWSVVNAQNIHKYCPIAETR